MSIQISNAGLVLLHPFLPGLFQELYLTRENKWIDIDSRDKAVLFLGFLATGSMNYDDNKLALCKILCGMDISVFADIEMRFDDTSIKACDELLNNTISQWSSLKNTSIAGLREAFLQRNAKLLKIENGWMLKVEKSGVDVLLNQLPWNICIINLPWMNESLTVDWH